MFSVRLVKADHYMNIPIPGLDARYSEFRGFEVRQVPVIRIFGSTGSGQKVCLHIHGVFPYIYIPYDGCIEKEKFMYQIASAIDKAINISQGNSNSQVQHIYKITHVSAKPLYGYHSNAHQFLKIYFYNPLMVKKASDLLQNGVILGQVFQPHEAHVPFILQFCMDYNLHGMSFVKLACVRYRQGAVEGSFVKPATLDNVPEELLLPDRILRTSTCSLEVDAVAADILNQQEISGQLTSNPGLKAIWDEEKERRRNENRNSQFTPQNSQTRHSSSTASERFHLDRLKKRLCEVTLLNENSKPVMEKSPSGEKPKPYPAPTQEGESSLEASFLVSHVNSLCHERHSKELTEKCVQIECVDVNKSAALPEEDTEPGSSQSSVLNSQCLSLVKILQDLIEDDSVLGSQHQQGDEDENEGASDNEDVLSQTLDNEKLECESLLNSSLRTSYNEETVEISGSSGKDKCFSLPQVDGANDVLKEQGEIEEDSLQLKLLEQPQEQQEQLQEQQFNLVLESDDYCLTGVVLDISLPSDLPLSNEPEGLCEDRLDMLNCDEKVEIVPTFSVELSESTDNFEASEPTGIYLINLNQQDEKKPMFLPESVGTESVDNDKDVLPECLLLGDPWLTSQQAASEKDEYLNESFSSTLKDSWPIDTDSSAWFHTNEKYFSEKSLITLSEVDETSSQYETGTFSELSVEKSNRENCVSTSETKRRLSTLIKSRTKAKEEQTNDKINSELISVDDINCDLINANDFEISAPFGGILQGEYYDHFLDESCSMSVQAILNNIDNSLINDGGLVCDMKTVGSGAILECSKNKDNNVLDESQLLESVRDGTVDDVHNKMPKLKKLPILSHTKFIKDGPVSKQLLEGEDNRGLKEHLPNGMLNCLVPGMKRRGRKPKNLKAMENNVSKDTKLDKLEKIENYYKLRNRVKHAYVKGRRRPKQLSVQLKANQYDTEGVTKGVGLTSDVVQDTININNRTVKERLGILVRNSIDKKYPVRECSLEEKYSPHNTFIDGPNTRQCLDTSLSFPNPSHCEQCKFADDSNAVALRKEMELNVSDVVDKKSYSHKEKEHILNKSNFDVNASELAEHSLKFEEHRSNSSCVISLERKAKTNDSEEDVELTKKRMGQYVRHRLGILVESRSKLLTKSIDKTVPLPSKVPSSCESNGSCSKIHKRQRRSKRKVMKSFGADPAVNSEISCNVNNNSGPNTCDIASLEKEELFLDDKISAINTFLVEEKPKGDDLKEDLQLESSILENQVDNKVPETKYSQSVEDLLNLYCIRSCCVKLQKLNREKLNRVNLLKSQDGMTNSNRTPGNLLLVNLYKSNLNCDNENSKLACAQQNSSEGYNLGKKFLETKEVGETDSHSLHKYVLLPNMIPEFVNPEHSNRLECEELNMKCVVPNSPKSIDKTEKNAAGEVGSLKAVVQAESPRVADTLDMLPENPSQNIRHYALRGSVYLNATDSESVLLLGDYLKEGNVVEVAKIPSIDLQSTSNIGCELLSAKVTHKEELQNHPAMYIKENKNINCCESSEANENCGTEFLTFTRVSPRKRSIRNSEKHKRKREKLSGNSPPIVSCILPSDVNIPVLSNKVASFEDNCNKFEGQNSRDTNGKDITVRESFSKKDKLHSCHHNVNVENKLQNEKNGCANLSHDSLLPINILKENAPSLSRSNSPTFMEYPGKWSKHLQSELKPEVPITENKQLIGETKLIKHATELQNTSENLNKKTFSLSESTSNKHIRKSNRIKLNSMKLSKRNCANELLSLNKNYVVENSKRGLSLSKPEENVSINVQLKPVTLLNESIGEKSESIAVTDNLKINENYAEYDDPHFKPTKIVHKLRGVSVTGFQLSHKVPNLYSNSEEGKKELNTAVVENVVGEIRKQRSIPCVDGANDSSSSDASNDFMPLAVVGHKLKKRGYRRAAKQGESGDVSEEGSSVSQTCDVNFTPGEEKEVESLGKSGPVKSPRKQTYRPLDVVIKKSPVKNKTKHRPQVDIPTENDYVCTEKTKYKIHEDLIKYLSSVLRKRITKQDVRKFNPHVMVTRLNSCIPIGQTVNIHTSRLRRKKSRDGICVCDDHGQNKSIADKKCEKAKGLSLDLHSEQCKKMTSGFKHQGEDLYEVSCLRQTVTDEERQEILINHDKNIISMGTSSFSPFDSRTDVVSSSNTVEQLSSVESNDESDTLACRVTSNLSLQQMRSNAKVPERSISLISSISSMFINDVNIEEMDISSEYEYLDEESRFQNDLMMRNRTIKPVSPSPNSSVVPDPSNILPAKLCIDQYSVDTLQDNFNNTIIIIPKKMPPSRKQVMQSLTNFHLPEQIYLKPFFSNASDVMEKKEVGHKNLKIQSHSTKELEPFDSLLPGLRGLEIIKNEALHNLWEQSQSSGNVQTAFNQGNIKAALAGQREIVVTPSSCAPSVWEVELWAKARSIFKEMTAETNVEGNEDATKLKSLVLKNDDKILSSTASVLSNGPELSDDNMRPCSSQLDLQEEAAQSYPFKGSSTEYSYKSNDNSVLKSSDDACGVKKEQNTSQNSMFTILNTTLISSKSACSQKVNNDCNSTVRNLLAQTQFRQQLVTPESHSKSHDFVGFKMSYENLQDCRAVVEPQYLTLLAIELHVQTRGDLRPDPTHDPVCGVFYCVQNDVPEESVMPKLITGMIVVQDPAFTKSFIIHNTEVSCKTLYVSNEKSLMEKVIQLVQVWDPDILVGYEVEMLSWGYLFERAFILEMNMCPLVSRTPNARQGNQGRNSLDESVMELSEEFSLVGRIMLNGWRLMRHEVALQSYSFENVSFHVLHERIPLVSFKTLTKWWGHRTRYFWGRVADHYLLRVQGLIRILEQLDLINRTSELARIFGIQFYEVLSRGSQFRVESMMLRLAKPLNFIPVSPSVQQRARMRAPECLQLIMEPESQLYVDPMIVLDFQSLYPSMIIAYNYCYSTCIGRVEHLGQTSPFEFGCSHLRVPPDDVKNLLNNLNISPCGVAFVNSTVRKGIMPRMLEEILETRLMVKKSMKEHKDDKTLQRVLHARQLGLKLIANVTYGYTAANFSGRMACVEVGDSVVSKGRETLERAIRLVESTPRWGARVVYGDTDSLFVLVPGRSREDAFVIGAEIAATVTDDNPSPVKLKLEKVYQPCLLQTKKRYVGYMYESPNQKDPVYDAKGIETVRRDGCPAVAKVLEKSLHLLFETKDVSKVKAYVQRKFSQLLEGQMNIQDLTFAREYRGSSGYKPGACVPALELSKRWLSVDPRAEPRVSERVPYVVISGAPNVPLIQLVRSPHELLAETGLRVHAHYYVSRVLCPPLARCFSLLGADVLSWYTDLPRRIILSLPKSVSDKEHKKMTISQYFSTSNCAVCHQICQSGICSECRSQPQITSVTLAEKLHEWERRYFNLEKICQSCCRYYDNIECISLDCPVMYHRNEARHTILQESFIRNLQENLQESNF